MFSGKPQKRIFPTFVGQYTRSWKKWHPLQDVIAMSVWWKHQARISWRSPDPCLPIGIWRLSQYPSAAFIVAQRLITLHNPHLHLLFTVRIWHLTFLMSLSSTVIQISLHSLLLSMHGWVGSFRPEKNHTANPSCMLIVSYLWWKWSWQNKLTLFNESVESVRKWHWTIHSLIGTIWLQLFLNQHLTCH